MQRESPQKYTPQGGSSSTVRNFAELIGKRDLLALNENVKFASIGPITTQTAEEMGLRVTIKANEYTISGLISAILENVAVSPAEKS